MDGFYGQDSTRGPSPIPHSWSLLVIWPLTSHGVSHWEGIPFQGIHRKKKSADSMDSTGRDQTSLILFHSYFYIATFEPQWLGNVGDLFRSSKQSKAPAFCGLGSLS